MRALFIHQNFPAQFRHVANALMRRPGIKLAAVTDAANKQTIEGLAVGRYELPSLPRNGASAATVALSQRFRRAEAVAATLIGLRQRQFVPDIILGHPGWGETMLVKEIFPHSRFVAHAEFYYSAEGGDVGFDAEFPDVTDELRVRLKAKNIPLLAALTDCDLAVAPTAWQASRFPAALAGKIETIHEGIRTDLAMPDPRARYGHGLGGLTLTPADEVITFVNRNLEPMRGFHIFMRALPRILEARPNAHVVIVGGNGVSYGVPPPSGRTWKDLLMAEVGAGLPKERVHFVGQIPYAQFIALMQVSRLHIYATYPFVLSWSMLEAMSAGALVLGSATPPVTEIIEHGRNGLLYDFFDADGLVGSAIDALAEPERYRSIRAAARSTMVERYDLATVCLPAWLRLIDTEAGRATAARSRN